MDTEQPTYKPLRDARGRLLPGQTANPLGRPVENPNKLMKKVRSVLIEKNVNPAEELIRMLSLKKLTPKIRVEILKTLLEWSESKPVKETHNVNESVNLNKTLEGLTPEQLVAALKTCEPRKDGQAKEAPAEPK